MLIKCSECRKEISDKAKTCPHCGAPVNIDSTTTSSETEIYDKEKTSSSSNNDAQTKPKTSKDMEEGGGCGGAIVFLIIILIGSWLLVRSCNSCLFSDSNSSNSSSSERSSYNSTQDSTSSKKIEAWGAAQRYVKQNLKAPSTASFGSLFGDYQSFEDVVRRSGDNKYIVNAWVDSENSFGATIRTYFYCELEEKSYGSYDVTSFYFK